jgi:hypothetical protein
MNCGLCIAYRRERKPCAGCRGADLNKPQHCVTCRLKTCPELAASGQAFCGDCTHYPCRRLRQLDQRYRAKYHMSMLDNLAALRAVGVDAFMEQEKTRWRCPHCGGVICVHRPTCLSCGQPWG